MPARAALKQRLRSPALLTATLMVALLACKSQQEEQRQKEKQVETAQEALARTQREECARLRNSPESLLETSGLVYYDKGIINDYRQLTGMTVLNKARYCAVRSAEGDVTWTDEQGRRFGSTPFSLKKSIPAGATEKFSTEDGTLTSGTLQASAKKAQVKFTRVDVISPP